MHLESPARWYARMPPPIVTRNLAGATLRCFEGTSRTVEQPALDENVLCMHLGAPKRVSRWQGSRWQTWDVPVHAITVMPAFRGNRWRTDGVIAYAHLTLSTDLLCRWAQEEFDRDPAELLLLDRVGVVDPLIAELMLTLAREATVSGPPRLYRDSLLTTLGITLLKRHSSLAPSGTHADIERSPTRGGLAGWQLRRVIDHMEANATSDVGIDELVRITGLSRAQFFRAFRRSTGDTPACHMQRHRMRHAATLLDQGRTVGEVADIFRYSNGSHFAAAFWRVHGVNPSDWRRMQRAGPSRWPPER
ncbi:helix-turn-helix domain-containing protein [Lichenicoccus sp.]|uniref:helix-turn-helix domain-containing protein n=1 Tax=Lichenicoccus sp. TaxID=2781899 RepID=UPI003D123E18